jgi:predicted ATP-dependent serine protease
VSAAATEQVRQFQDRSDELYERFGILTRDELANLPAVEPLIDNTLDRRSMAVLAGYWGTGKSFLALDWACSVATSTPWNGREITAGNGPNRVLYVVGEGAYGIHERIRAWELEHDITVRNLWVLPGAINLLDRHEVLQLAELVGGSQIDLVVIDTLSRATPGADENSAKDMSAAVANVDLIKNARAEMLRAFSNDGGGTCVLLVHHTGKDRTTIRGSSVLEGAADTVYQVEGDGQLMRVERTKRKDGPLEDVHQLSIRRREGSDSAVIRCLSAVKPRSSNQDRMLSAFVSAFGSTGATKTELRHIVDMPPATFHRAISALVREGKLINSGTEKRPFYKPSPDLDLSA